MQPRSKSRSALAMALFVTAVLPSSVAGGKPDAVATDISETAEGRRAATEAAERMTSAYGIATDAADLGVWTYGDHVIAGPKGSKVTFTEVPGKDGDISVVVHATEPTGPASVSQAEPALVAAASTGWQLVGSYCWTDQNRNGGYMDVCYHKHKATSDGSTSYDYYTLDMFSTFAASPPYEIGDPWITAWPASGSPAATWFDWKPRTDTTQCGTVNLSIGPVNGYPLSLSGTQCETWDITKYAAAGQFKNAWREGICQVQQGERELEFTAAVRVGQGKVPTWSFDWRKSLQVASCAL